MQIHILRNNENIEDLSLLYSVKKEIILYENRIDEIKENMEILIPLEDFYYFKQRCESIDSVIKKFDISMKELYKLNKKPLAFKDGTIRLKIKQKKKEIRVYSLIDLNLKDNIFIEGDLENEYVDEFIGYNFKSVYEKAEDFYIKKLYTVHDKKISALLECSKFMFIDNIIDFIKNLKNDKVYNDIYLFYDNFEFDLKELFHYISDYDIRINLVLDHIILDKIIEDINIVKYINKNAKRIFILPSDIKDTNHISKNKYADILKKISVFDNIKCGIGINLNKNNDISLMELSQIFEYMYDFDIKNIILYDSGNRFFKIRYFFNHFFYFKE